MKDRQYFTFLKSYCDIYAHLNDSQKVAFVDAIIAHQMKDAELDEIKFEDTILNIAWAGIKHSLAKAKAQYLNGKKAKTKPTGSQKEAKPKQIRNKKKEIRNKKQEVNINIEEFVPNQVSVNACLKEYPTCNVDELVDDFKDQAKNRKAPFKDLQSGFRNYVRKGWVSPNTKKSLESHSERAKAIMNPLLRVQK